MSLDVDPDHAPPAATARIVAIIEILLCSDFPTQFAIGITLGAFGLASNTAAGHLSVPFVVVLSVADTALLLGLIILFLLAHGEHPREVLLGRRRLVPEITAGVPLILVALGIGVGVLIAIQKIVPSMHTVEQNPLQELLRSPRDAWLFAFVVVIAGGVREEIQRAFLLHRFEVWLGGGAVGVVVTSVAFGVGHLLQGVDAAVATGLLGAFWGAIYLRRRSAVAPMVSHAGFDLLQIAAQVMVGGRS